MRDYRVKPAPREVGDPLVRLAFAQGGVFSRAQAIEIGGLTPDEVDNRVRTRRFVVIHRAVYAFSPVLTEHGERAAALLAMGRRGAALSHSSAGALWGFFGHPDGPHHVTVPVGGSRELKGVKRHRTRGFSDGDLAVVGGLVVTSPARTFLDLAMSHDAAAVRAAMREAQYARLIDPHALALAVDAHPMHPGRAVLREAEPELQRYEGTESPLEDEILDLILAAGLPKPARQVWVTGASGRPYRLDFLFRNGMVGVEADGRNAHARAIAFEEDRDRDTDIAAVGILPMRFTRVQARVTPEVVTSRTADRVRARA